MTDTALSTPHAVRGASSRPTDAVDYIALLEERHAYFEQLRRISEQLSALIKPEESASLLMLVERRRATVERLIAIEGDLAPVRADWRRWVTGLSPADRQRVGSLVDDDEAIRLAVIKQDERDREALERVRAELGDQLGRLQQGGKAMAAYRVTPSAGKNRFTDRQG